MRLKKQTELVTYCQRKSIYKKLPNKSGIVFYVVLAAVTIMSIFILFYHQFSRQLAFSTFYHVNRDKLRNITDVILDSAFANVQVETRNSSGAIAQTLISNMKNRVKTSFSLKAPLYEANKESLLNGLQLSYDLSGKLFDSRVENYRGHPFQPGEGLGTLEISLDASLKTNSGKILAKCHRVRHFDMKIACLVANSSANKTSYTMGFPLEYALLVRAGLREFNSGSRGQKLNAGKKLEIADQSKAARDDRGFIYFGESDSNDENSRVYLNISDEFSGGSKLFPVLTEDSLTISQTEALKFHPTLQGNNYQLNGLKGKFSFKILPAISNNNKLSSLEKSALAALAIDNRGKSFVQLPGCIDIEGPKTRSYLESIFKGTLTQRFLYYVQYDVDASNLTVTTGGQTTSLPQSELNKIENRCRFFSISPQSKLFTNSQNLTPSVKALLDQANKVKDFINRKAPSVNLFSELNEEHLLYEGQTFNTTAKKETFSAAPTFFSRNGKPLSSLLQTGGEGFRPFRHCTLYSARFFSMKELEQSGVYNREEGILNLRGIVSLENENFRFSPPKGKKNIIVRGQGVILAPHGFTIQAGLKLANSSKDTCILFSRKGTIKVATNEKIEASLLAFNDDKTGTIIAYKPYSVLGAVGVDQLNADRYPTGISKIEYDPRLKTQTDSEQIFSLTLSPWIRFEDVSYQKGS